MLALLSISANASIDQGVNEALMPITAAFSNFVFYKISLFGFAMPIIVLWLAVAAVFFTVYLGFINIRAFPYAVKMVSGKYTDKSHPGEISHFQVVRFHQVKFLRQVL